MINITLKQLFTLLFLSGSLGIAYGSEPSEEGDSESNSRRARCISQMTIRDYRILDDGNLIVSGAGRRRYHVELAYRAFGLRSSWQIGFYSRTGQICSGFSYLIVDEGMGKERVPIRSIRQLTPEEEEALLIEFGEIEPESEPAPDPKAVEGAEVEELD